MKHLSETSPGSAVHPRAAAAGLRRPAQPARNPSRALGNPTGRSPLCRAAHSHHASPKIRGRLYKTRPHHLAIRPPPTVLLAPPFWLSGHASPHERPALPLHHRLLHPRLRRGDLQARRGRRPVVLASPFPPDPEAAPQPGVALRVRPRGPPLQRPPRRRPLRIVCDRRLRAPVRLRGYGFRRPGWTNWVKLLHPSALTSLCLGLFFPLPATRNTYDEILTGLGRPGGGEEFGKYYSLPALSDPRIGEFVVTLQYSILA